jgi:asparagine synthetase B (glutamine-hydrolysing)
MCGLSGFVDLRDDDGKGELLRRMNRKFSHRGPDAKGYYGTAPRPWDTGGSVMDFPWFREQSG